MLAAASHIWQNIPPRSQAPLTPRPSLGMTSDSYFHFQCKARHQIFHDQQDWPYGHRE